MRIQIALKPVAGSIGALLQVRVGTAALEF